MSRNNMTFGGFICTVLACVVGVGAAFQLHQRFGGDDSDSSSVESEHEHSWDEYDVLIEPTCTDVGVYIERCTCGKLGDSYSVPALGHTIVSVPGKSPTCSESGLTAGSSCSVCGEVFTAQTEIEMSGHVDLDVDGVCDDCLSVVNLSTFTSDSGNYTIADVSANESLAGNVYRINKIGQDMDGDTTNGNECWFINNSDSYTHFFIAPESYDGMVFGFGDAEWSESSSTCLYFFVGYLDETGAFNQDIEFYDVKIDTVGIKYNHVISEDKLTFCYVDIYFERGSTITIADGSKSYTLNVDELVWLDPYETKRLVPKACIHTDVDGDYLCDDCGEITDILSYYGKDENHTRTNAVAGESVAGNVYRIYFNGSDLDGDTSNGYDGWFTLGFSTTGNETYYIKYERTEAVLETYLLEVLVMTADGTIVSSRQLTSDLGYCLIKGTNLSNVGYVDFYFIPGAKIAFDIDGETVEFSVDDLTFKEIYATGMVKRLTLK